MAALLQKLADRRDIMLVMGGIRPGLDLRKTQLRRWAGVDPARNTLLDVPRSWLAIDVDGYHVPAPLGLAEYLPDAAAAIRDDALGDFAGVACVVAATSSTGLAGEDTARLRLFFLLDAAHPIADLHRWARGAQLAGLPVDPAVMQPGQPIYTSRPVFRGVLTDPVPAQLRAFVLPAAGGGDRVAIDIHGYDRQAEVVQRHVDHAWAQCGGDWRQLLDETLGGPAGFFLPATRALGLAARSPDDEATIIGHVAALVAARADEGRQRQYGPRWVQSTLRRFRTIDGMASGDIAQKRRQLFTGGDGNG